MSDSRTAELLAAYKTVKEHVAWRGVWAVISPAGMLAYAQNDPMRAAELLGWVELRIAAYEQLANAAAVSPWIPPEYTSNDWLADLRAFLLANRPEHGNAAGVCTVVMPHGEVSVAPTLASALGNIGYALAAPPPPEAPPCPYCKAPGGLHAEGCPAALPADLFNAKLTG